MSIVLDGNTAHLKINSTLGFGANNAAARTWAIHFRRGRQSYAQIERLLTHGYWSSSTTFCALQFSAASNVLRALSYFSATDESVGDDLVTADNQWHLAILRMTARNGAGPQAIQCILDDNFYSTDTSIRTNTGTFEGLFVGRRSGESNLAGNYQFMGHLAYLAGWGVWLSDGECAALRYQAPESLSYDTNSASDLKVCWSFDNSLTDSVGGYVLLNYNGLATYSSDMPALSGAPTSSFVTRAYHFLNGE